MFDVGQFLLSLLGFVLFQHAGLSPPQQQPDVAHTSKSVAIVGAGSAGLAMLRALVDLEDKLRSNFNIVVYEQRRDVGGIWLPDPQPIRPPILPETPLYPNLHTNVPIPTMTFPGFPFSLGTPLFAHHEYIERYHQAFAQQYNLMPYILLNHTVLFASWVGSPEEGRWDIVVAGQDGHEMRRSFDHLVIANGHNYFPHMTTFPGQDEWLRHRNSASGRRRKILHSVFYREPQQYVNQTVVVVGSGASGRDIASQVVSYARKVYHSVRSQQDPATGPVEVVSEIAYLTPDAIVFADGSQLYDVDSVVLGTGYDLRIPFLETSGEVTLEPKSSERGPRLTTNLRYLFPLHQHIFSLSASHPPNALAFIGLPILVSNCPSDLAQSIYAANIIVNASLLPSREEMLADLDASEDGLRLRGYDPYYIGHRMVEGSTFDYQDHLITHLKKQGAIPNDGIKFVEVWRREAASYQFLKRGWKRVEDLGLQKEWLRGVETEAEWANMMGRLNAWQEEWETTHGLTFPEEQTVF